jgi:hypothetical protein
MLTSEEAQKPQEAPTQAGTTHVRSRPDNHGQAGAHKSSAHLSACLLLALYRPAVLPSAAAPVACHMLTSAEAQTLPEAPTQAGIAHVRLRLDNHS